MSLKHTDLNKLRIEIDQSFLQTSKVSLSILQKLKESLDLILESVQKQNQELNNIQIRLASQGHQTADLTSYAKVIDAIESMESQLLQTNAEIMNIETELAMLHESESGLSAKVASKTLSTIAHGLAEVNGNLAGIQKELATQSLIVGTVEQYADTEVTPEKVYNAFNETFAPLLKHCEQLKEQLKAKSDLIGKLTQSEEASKKRKHSEIESEETTAKPPRMGK